MSMSMPMMGWQAGRQAYGKTTQCPPEYTNKYTVVGLYNSISSRTSSRLLERKKNIPVWFVVIKVYGPLGEFDCIISLL